MVKVELNLSKNNIFDTQCVDLLYALSSNQHLTHIDLSQNEISNKSVKVLAEVLSYNTSLKVINLADNQIQKTVCDALITCSFNHPSMIHLNLTRNNFSYNDCADIQDFLRFSQKHCRKPLSVIFSEKLGGVWRFVGTDEIERGFINDDFLKLSPEVYEIKKVIDQFRSSVFGVQPEIFQVSLLEKELEDSFNSDLIKSFEYDSSYSLEELQEYSDNLNTQVNNIINDDKYKVDTNVVQSNSCILESEQVVPITTIIVNYVIEQEPILAVTSTDPSIDLDIAQDSNHDVISNTIQETIQETNEVHANTDADKHVEPVADAYSIEQPVITTLNKVQELPSPITSPTLVLDQELPSPIKQSSPVLMELDVSVEKLETDINDILSDYFATKTNKTIDELPVSVSLCKDEVEAVTKDVEQTSVEQGIIDVAPLELVTEQEQNNKIVLPQIEINNSVEDVVFPILHNASHEDSTSSLNISLPQEAKDTSTVSSPISPTTNLKISDISSQIDTKYKPLLHEIVKKGKIRISARYLNATIMGHTSPSSPRSSSKGTKIWMEFMSNGVLNITTRSRFLKEKQLGLNFFLNSTHVELIRRAEDRRVSIRTNGDDVYNFSSKKREELVACFDLAKRVSGLNIPTGASSPTTSRPSFKRSQTSLT
ncbi:roco5 [Acrasis kona]|uniref:Roco5 n=1 Tax=Acrasis kona TaxID=1008807 RepID=A0AAW2YME5_9EUKA